mmetsp:Transcript_24573/g.18632  ORF Transcript_24573/g.18632 Transcript_24573/m.18632 type:complete len:84 (+) Transcript_24573:1012-1263(+)
MLPMIRKYIPGPLRYIIGLIFARFYISYALTAYFHYTFDDWFTFKRSFSFAPDIFLFTLVAILGVSGIPRKIQKQFAEKPVEM